METGSWATYASEFCSFEADFFDTHGTALCFVFFFSFTGAFMVYEAVLSSVGLCRALCECLGFFIAVLYSYKLRIVWLFVTVLKYNIVILEYSLQFVSFKYLFSTIK